MCVAYSTLGNLQKLDDATAMLLVIYMMHNFRKRVWVLVHENVKGFLSDTLTDVAAEYGYDHFQIQCKTNGCWRPCGTSKEAPQQSLSFFLPRNHHTHIHTLVVEVQ